MWVIHILAAMGRLIGSFWYMFGFCWPKKWSRGSGSGLKSFLDALGSIWVKYQPKRSHGHPFEFNVYYFLPFSDDHFCENQLFLKKPISRGSSGQSAKLKMTAYRSSNSEVLTVFWPFWCIFTLILSVFLKTRFSILGHVILVSKESVLFPHIFDNKFALRDSAPVASKIQEPRGEHICGRSSLIASSPLLA